MIPKNLNRCLAFVLCFCMVFSLLPISAFATEGNAGISENSVVQGYQTQMNDMLAYYLGSTDVASEDVPALAANLDEYALSDAAFEILILTEDMTYSMEDGEMTEDEAKLLIENNPAAVAFSDYVMDYAEMPAISLYKDHTPIDGITVGVSGSNSDSLSEGALTVTVKGSGGIFGYGASSATATITVTNNTGKNGTVSFDWTASSVTQLIIDGEQTNAASGSFAKTLSVGGSFNITITTGKNNTTNKLVMRNFVFEESLSEAKVTVNYNGSLGSVTANGTAVAANSVYTFVAEGDQKNIDFVATPNSGTDFVAWVDSSTNQILSTNAAYNIEPTTNELSIKAVFGTAAHFHVGNILYESWESAISAANGSGTIVLVNNGILPQGNYTIPSGVTLLIPYDNANTVIRDNMTAMIAGDNYQLYPAQVEYRSLTIPSGVNITVASGGAICVGSKAHKMMVGQTGPYGAIYLDSGANITLQSGSNLYAWGYIFPGSNGSGTVTAESGSAVYEPLAIMDYPGDAGTTLVLFGGHELSSNYDISSLYKNLEGGRAFPLRDYTPHNVEVSMTIKHGAKNYVFYHLHGDTAGDHGGYVTFIGNESDSMFQLSDSGSTAVKSYSNGRLRLKLDGNVSFNSLHITLKVPLINEANIDSDKVSGLYVPSCYDVEFINGTGVLNENIIFCEGTTFKIGSKATVRISSGKSLYILDAADDLGAVAQVDVHGTSYTNVDRDAVVDINGTVIVEGGFYTSNGKASIISSEGTGRVEIPAASQGKTIDVKYGTNTVKDDIPVTPAYLQNANGNYISTAEQGTYTYGHGAWIKGTHADTPITYKNDGSTHSATYDCCGSIAVSGESHNYVDHICDKCKDVEQFTITLNTDGGDAMAAITQDYGTAVSVGTPTRTGYAFTGWTPEAPATMPAENMTLTAQWEIGTFTITFNTNGGSVVEAITGEYNTPVTAPEDPTKDGYIFAGWDADIPSTIPGENVTINAQWTPIEYTITFDTDGGTDIAPITQGYETVIQAPADPTKEGYTFAGWSPALPEKMPLNGNTYTAQWKINQYTITFVDTDGSELAKITKDYGTKVTAPANPTKEGYTFAGWDQDIPATMPAEDVTITAKWTVNQYTITFDTDGGSEITSITQDYGTAVDVSEPTKTGYTFAGWTPEIPATMPAKDMDVKANWTVNQYTITFVGAEIDPITADYGAEVTAPANPTKEGHTFAGWDVDIPTTMPAGDMTITANWTVNEYIVTWIVDGVETTDTVEFGAEIAQPEAPTKAQVGCTTYTFSEWTPNVPDTMPAENLIFTALFNEGESHDWSGEITYDWVKTDDGYTVTATRTCVRNCGASETATGSASYSMDTEANCQVGEIGTWTASFDAAWADEAGAVTKNVTGEKDRNTHASNAFIYVVNNDDGTHTKKMACCEAEVETKAHDYTNGHMCECGDAESFTIQWYMDGEVVKESVATYNQMILNKPADPAKEGYTFTGWYTAETEGEKLADNAVCDGTTAYYAQFTINQYTIRFNTDGGNEIEAITANYGTTVTAPADPTKTGYTFAGWDVEIPATMPAEDIEITAQWTINKYTITFDTDGGTEIKPITLDYNSAVTAPENPTKTGYKFISWDKTIPTAMPAEDVTITAKWEIKTYIVKWENEGENYATTNVKYGEPIELPQGQTPTKTADGCKTYEFTGWKDYTEGMTMPDDENLVFTAQYKEVMKHALTKTDHKDATCTADGNIAYWTCENCKKIFNNENATTEVTAEQTIIGKTKHNLVQTPAKSETCTENGNNEYWACADCKYIFKDSKGETLTTIEDETIPKLGHDMTEVAAKAADCANPGNNAYWFCDRCEKAFKDADGAVETTVEAETIAALNHGNVTEATKWESDDAGHWQTCPNCSEKVNSGEHSYVDGVCVCGKAEPITEKYVAKIGSKNYLTLTDAINASVSGDTITLLTDVVEKPDAILSSGVTINVSGKSLWDANIDSALNSIVKRGPITEKADGGFEVVKVDETNWKVTSVFNSSISAGLLLEAEVQMQVNFKTTNGKSVNPECLGVLIWPAEDYPGDENVDVDTCSEANILRNPVWSSNSGGRYEIATSGIPAKEWGDSVTFVPFYTREDGSYVYGRVIKNYSPRTYCYNKLKDGDSNNDALMISILNYGAAAQKKFAYRTDDLMNSDLTATQQVLNWNESLVRSDWDVPVAKAGQLVRNTTVVPGRGGGLELLGAIDTRYYIHVAANISVKDVKILCWTEEDYNNLNVLTTDNASFVEKMDYVRAESKGARYEYSYTGLAAKEIFTKIYTCAVVTDTDGNVYYGGVLGYSPERYIYINASKADANGELAKRLAIYADAARTYFG